MIVIDLLAQISGGCASLAAHSVAAWCALIQIRRQEGVERRRQSFVLGNRSMLELLLGWILLLPPRGTVRGHVNVNITAARGVERHAAAGYHA